MVNPKTFMAHVLILFSIVVQAQSVSDNNILCYIGEDNEPHKVNTIVTQQKPYTITCKYEDGNVSIPKFLQFTCHEQGSTSLTVKVTITGGTHTQVITKDIQVSGSSGIYEVPVWGLVRDELIQSGKARIKSISFVNNMNVEVLISEVHFSNSSANYEVKINQVFTIDLRSELQKRYYISAPTFKTVSVNLYRPDGEFDQKILKGLTKGDNFLEFNQLGIKEGKYVIVITESDQKKSPSSRITVMN